MRIRLLLCKITQKYIPSSNLLFCGYYDAIYHETYDEIYDETYGVIFKVIMRKFRAVMEPLYDLKIGKYVEYLACVSSEYIKSAVTFSDKHGWSNFTRSLGLRNPKLYIARMLTVYSIHACNSTYAKTDLYCTVGFVSMIEALRSVIFIYYRGRELIC